MLGGTYYNFNFSTSQYPQLHFSTLNISISPLITDNNSLNVTLSGQYFQTKIINIISNLFSSDSIISNSIFNSNSAESSGGAINVYLGQASIISNVFENNVASYGMTISAYVTTIIIRDLSGDNYFSIISCSSSTFSLLSNTTLTTLNHDKSGKCSSCYYYSDHNDKNNLGYCQTAPPTKHLSSQGKLMIALIIICSLSLLAGVIFLVRNMRKSNPYSDYNEIHDKHRFIPFVLKNNDNNI
ncbi:hypothetical protein CYY_008713 [Polysphondylium violaceum]|uniref:Uncharacterized protein n=1 Tax=Polysphondylium violaceum TaxID=133409 RepID=A0A8J4PMM8_9MYCE|nr:hypothetical protein CYY_008713 [Polysphondylium violaceum]